MNKERKLELREKAIAKIREAHDIACELIMNSREDVSGGQRYLRTLLDYHKSEMVATVVLISSNAIGGSK